MGTSDWGHYYSYIRKDNEWMEFNDQLVTRFDSKNLKSETFGGEENI